MTDAVQPYRTTPVFDADTLPAALRRAHHTKAGVWGRISVLSGALRYVVALSGDATVLRAGDSVIVQPEQRHHVEPLAAMQMQIAFYTADPSERP